MGDHPTGRTTSVDNTSTAQLVQRATEQISGLIRDELALARIELAEKGKRAGIGAGLFGGGGALAFYAGGVLVAAAVVGLSYVIPAALAALVVGVVLLVVAGLFARSGKKQVDRAMPPMPKSTVRNLRADAETVRGAARDRGRS
ncbi:phage holin family protein [Plantactinospora sp. CA-290183]|uniref:phage holin family protein n=1 Tax=Plantactinospora sp. CA-290183 TaxID=3240006 RepID=UPI003D8E679F